ncbi:MAG: mevalonate kinase [Candidatus Heimdallarchaeota archaeon]|nr:mevalonate kinase [Candidatus Heimdallarchaeota archaeon]
MNEFGYGSAPGKLIISGDHSVVYGQPAIAIALDLRCYVKAWKSSSGLIIHAKNLGDSYYYTISELQNLQKTETKFTKIDGIALGILITLGKIKPEIAVEVNSDIPMSAGLGSSAAVAVACIAAVCDLYGINISNEKISEIAFESEKIIHGRPSGIDNTMATYGGMLVFENGNITLQELNQNIPLIIIDSQVDRDTKKMVSSVAELKEKYNEINEIIRCMGNVSRAVITSINNGNLKSLGDLLNINQGLLDAIGVNHPKLSELIWCLREAGCFGAKITGAGGGGCVFGIAEDAESIVSNLTISGSIIITNASLEGVKIGR